MVDDISLILITLGIAGGTLFLRTFFIFVFDKVELPDTVWDLLRFVPPAVLAALAIPAFITPVGNVPFLLGKERLVIGIVAVLVAWKTRSIFLTIVVGLAMLYGLNELTAMLG